MSSALPCRAESHVLNAECLSRCRTLAVTLPRQPPGSKPQGSPRRPQGSVTSRPSTVRTGASRGSSRRGIVKPNPDLKVKRLLADKGFDHDDIADSYLPVYLAALKAERIRVVQQRQEAGAVRVYDEAATARDMAVIFTRLIKETEVRMEEARLTGEDRDRRKAVDIVQERMEKGIQGSAASKEWEMERRRRWLEDKLESERGLLEDELSRVPPPKPRYSTRLLSMRHAESILNRTMRYEEAYDVRRLTKVLEAEEYEAKDDYKPALPPTL